MSRCTARTPIGANKQFKKVTARNLHKVEAMVARLSGENKKKDARTVVARRPSWTNLPSPTPMTTPRTASFPVTYSHSSACGSTPIRSTFSSPRKPPSTYYDGLELRHFAAIIAKGKSTDPERSRIISRVSEIYMQNICHHINQIYGCHLPGQTPLLLATDARFHQFLEDKEYYEGGVGGDYISSAARLRARGIDASAFMALHHFFIPIIYETYHAQLLIISPLTKTMQFFCSGEDPLADNREEVYAQACILIDSIVGNAFVPSEWLIRGDTGSKQGDTENCVVYVIANAVAVAFGYDTDFEGKSFVNARYRIASELLNGGFEPHDGYTRSQFYYPYMGGMGAVGSKDWIAYREQEHFEELVEEKDVKALVGEFDAHVWARSFVPYS